MHCQLLSKVRLPIKSFSGRAIITLHTIKPCGLLEASHHLNCKGIALFGIILQDQQHILPRKLALKGLKFTH